MTSMRNEYIITDALYTKNWFAICYSYLLYINTPRNHFINLNSKQVPLSCHCTVQLDYLFQDCLSCYNNWHQYQFSQQVLIPAIVPLIWPFQHETMKPQVSFIGNLGLYQMNSLGFIYKLVISALICCTKQYFE